MKSTDSERTNNDQNGAGTKIGLEVYNGYTQSESKQLLIKKKEN